MNEIDIYNVWDVAFRTSTKKARNCLVDGCNKGAIKSHTLQKNGILRPISEKNHLYQFSIVSPFQIAKKGNFELARIGINDAYTFPGFCKEHDSSIFKPIEKESFEIKAEKSINLFSYRSLCQEIRRKEISMDIAQKMIETNYNIELLFYMNDYKTGLLNGLKNLYFFKKELETDFKAPVGKFIHKIIEFPKIEICISAPLNIYDKNNELSKTHDSNGKVLNNPFVTSFLNIFPYKDKSYLLVSLNTDFYCNWTENLFYRFQNLSSQSQLKLISELISTRIEFWCISPKLKNEIKKCKLETLMKIMENEVMNFDSIIKNDFNLFAY